MSPNQRGNNAQDQEAPSQEHLVIMDEAIQTLAQLELDPEEPFVTIVDDVLPHQLDSIAWNHQHHLFSFGSYEIDPLDAGRRVGNLYLAKLCPNNVAGYVIIQTIPELPGILDIKWDSSTETKLVVATSEIIFIFRLEGLGPEETCSLVKTDSLKTFPDMVLYVTWLNGTDVLYSDSAGNVTVWTRADNGNVGSSCDDEGNHLCASDIEGGITTAPLHKFFVWFVHFDPLNQLVYSGDDAGYFRAFHLKDLKNPSVHAKHQFETGVTSILTKRDIVAVGCYDDHLRIFHRSINDSTGRVTISPSPLLDMDLCGTVWRTSWLPSLLPYEEAAENEKLNIAVAAGRNGIHVVSVNPQDWSYETTFCCLEHKGDLAYGLDIHANPDEGTYTMATVYFDSKRLHIFSLKA